MLSPGSAISAEQRLKHLIQADSVRMEILTLVATLELPDCYVAAGFIRNLVWDHLHGYPATPLNDIDVIYFDDTGKYHEAAISRKLLVLRPDMDWEVTNQAQIHGYNGDKPYKSTADAMSYWPEKETAVGARVTTHGDLDIIAPFGLERLFKGSITHNPLRPASLFQQRVATKQWQTLWPRLFISQ